MNNFAKYIILCLVIAAMLVGFTPAQAADEHANIFGTVIGDAVIELPVITEIDYEAGLEQSRATFGKFGCSAIAKTLDDGDTIVGRSFDLFYGNNPAFVIRTDVDGFYKTVGLAYNTFGGSSFEDIKENGVSYEELLSLLFFTEDIMNEKGLYLEANMRESQPESTGIAATTGTNPDAEVSIALPALVRYLGERCATVDEVVELVQTINIYGMITDTVKWGGGLLVADATGHYGVFELVDNKFIFIDGQNCQTNFYLNDEYKDIATIGSGVGRYELLESKIDTVESFSDMTELMKQVRYTQIRSPYTCLFDPCSESTGEDAAYESIGGVLTIEMCKDETIKAQVLASMDEHGKAENAKPLQQLKDEGTEWLSVWQTTANCNEQTIHVIFFEDDSLAFDFTV